ncbi:hypothetical protein [Sphingobacterium sp. HMA12]|uniref:hypothetical protein n=1 Tax=Sphingobacterium sp. HMA12 TaxID=2050894 RepID=UPI00131520B2|nr:hypothetical protein [Sphingobacterium sp. HMA12]
MTLAITLSILVLTTIYFLMRKRQQEQRFSRRVAMTVNYMFQDRPGQYSGDRNVKSGVFVFKAERHDDKLKNIVIRRVKPLNTALNVNLEQILVVPFGQQEGAISDVSVRFKVVKRGARLADLKGGRVSISGVMNFEQHKPEPFTATLAITDLYQGIGV